MESTRLPLHGRALGGLGGVGRALRGVVGRWVRHPDEGQQEWYRRRIPLS